MTKKLCRLGIHRKQEYFLIRVPGFNGFAYRMCSYCHKMQKREYYRGENIQDGLWLGDWIDIGYVQKGDTDGEKETVRAETETDTV